MTSPLQAERTPASTPRPSRELPDEEGRRPRRPPRPQPAAPRRRQRADERSGRRRLPRALLGAVRSYRYRIWRRPTQSPFERRRSLWHPRPLDLESLQAAGRRVVGEHDFRVHAHRDAPSTPPFGSSVRRDESWRHRCVHDHSRQLSASHGADAGRYDAGTGPGRVGAAARRPSTHGSGHDRAALGPLSRTCR